MIWIVALAIAWTISYLLYKFAKQDLDYWKKRGVVHDDPLPFFGNFFRVATLKESLGTFYNRKYMKYRKEKYIGLYEMKDPVFMPIDLKLIERVLVKDFSHFINRNVGTANVMSEVGMMLPVLKDGEWRGVRYKLTPAFSSGKLKNMFSYMINCANSLTEYIETLRNRNIDMSEASSQYSLDVISNCAFGIDVSKDKEGTSDFRIMGRKIFHLNTLAYYCYLIVICTPGWASKLKLSLIPGEVGNYFAKVFKETFQIRKSKKIVRNDFVDLLLQLKEKGAIEVPVKEAEDVYLDMDYKPTFESFEMTDKILVSQAFTFLTAGFDGLSTPLALITYELAKNSDIQEKVRREIHEQITSHGGLTYEALKKMTYLENCVHEGLRMYPLNTFLIRTCGRDYRLDDGVVIKAGTKTVIPVDALHHDPRFHPEPDTFKPERFQSKFSHHTTDFTYLPFGAGPRMCIAMRFALVTLKLGVASIFKDYQVSVSPKSIGPIEFKIKTFFVKSPKDNIYLKFNKTK